MGRDMTEISQPHSEIIRECFKKYRPRKIIETGTYQGIGSTKLIASLIRDLQIEDSKFYSIECNEGFYQDAKVNLTAHGMQDFVILMKGLSVPKSLLPNESETQEKIERALLTDGIKVDHAEVKLGSVLYSKEAQTDGQEDLLGYIIKKGCFNPDFVLLDSAGHIGSIEFEYFTRILTYPCLIGLDDTKHIKHFESKETMLSDSNRFEILYESSEHTGSLIAQFTP